MIDTSAGVLVRKRIYLDDLDGFGMLHHARYALLFDNAVIDFWADAGWELNPSESVLVIRELTLTYHQPVVGLSEVEVDRGDVTGVDEHRAGSVTTARRSLQGPARAARGVVAATLVP